MLVDKGYSMLNQVESAELEALGEISYEEEMEYVELNVRVLNAMFAGFDHEVLGKAFTSGVPPLVFYAMSHTLQ